MTADDKITLWRPIGPKELQLIQESGMRTFPPRLPEQPIFYPVLTEAYAVKIARDWNVKTDGSGYVTRFHVARAFLDRYEVQKAGGRDHLEYWIPAEDLPGFNAAIVGSIEVVVGFRSLNGAVVRLRKIYDLRDDVAYIAGVQKATMETLKFGLVPEHGLFGTAAWWGAIRDGKIPIHSVEGRITRVFMGSMNDWPEFEMETEDKHLMTWTRYGTVPDAGKSYLVGNYIRLQYVDQNPKTRELFESVRIPLSVWVAGSDVLSASRPEIGSADE
jgi:hypothetical protein